MPSPMPSRATRRTPYSRCVLSGSGHQLAQALLERETYMAPARPFRAAPERFRARAEPAGTGLWEMTGSLRASQLPCRRALVLQRVAALAGPIACRPADEGTRGAALMEPE